VKHLIRREVLVPVCVVGGSTNVCFDHRFLLCCLVGDLDNVFILGLTNDHTCPHGLFALETVVGCLWVCPVKVVACGFAV